MSTQLDLQRWSDDVARDPRSLAFLPLAKAYRRQGLTDAAMQLCLRGLEHHPAHVEAHSLLALLYLEQGQRDRAADEWSIVLRMDPANFEALRGMGFCYLEKDQLAKARQMLERAATLRPQDTMVGEALELLGARNDASRSDAAQRTDPLLRDDPWAASAAPQPDTAEDVPAESTAEEQPQAVFELVLDPEEEAVAAPAPVAASPRDPSRLFDDLLGTGPLLGALLVDDRGLVHAGRLGGDAPGDAELIGAVLGGAVEEAARTAQHLAVGAWRGVLLEAERALLQLSPVGADAVVILAARRNTPTGWLMRTGAQAAERASRYLGAHV